MKLLTKLSTAFFIISLFVIVVAYFGIESIDRINVSFDKVGTETIPIIEALKDLKIAGIGIESTSHDILFFSESLDENHIHQSVKELEKNFELYNDAFTRYELLTITYFPDEIGYLEKIDNNGNDLKNISREILELKKLDASGEQIINLHKELEITRYAFQNSIDEVLANEKDEFQERTEIIDQSIENADKNIILFSIITLFSSLVIGFFMAYHFSKPIVELKDAAIKVGQGKLDTRVDFRSNDELGVLSNAFNEMVRNLETDVEKLKQSRLAIEKLMRRIELILDNAGEGIFGVDTNGHITMINNAALTLTGFERNELLGRSSHEFIHHSRADGTRISSKESPVYTTYMIGKTYHIKEDTFWKKDGTNFPVDYVSTPIYEEGILTGAVVVFKDISDSKKIQSISLENDRLILTSKAKSEFLMTVSHELRTPLNSIIGFSEILINKQYGDLNEKQIKYLEYIYLSGNNLLTLINDILDLAKVEAKKIDLEINKISLTGVMDETICVLSEKAIRHKIMVKTDFDQNAEIIEADEQRVRQVLFNLLGNAMKFSKPEGGTVTITTGKEGDMIQVSVSDTGIGIKEEDMGKLFNEFEQIDKGTSRKYGGTGLGLVISKKLIELHGGRIWAKSEYGIGTKFTFTIPIKANSDQEKKNL